MHVMLGWKFSELSSSDSRSLSTEFTLLLDHEDDVTTILQNVCNNLPVDKVKINQCIREKTGAQNIVKEIRQHQ